MLSNVMSFRRTLSQAHHHRSHLNGLNSDLILVSSPSYKHLPSSTHTSPSSSCCSLSAIGHGFMRLLLGIFLKKYAWKGLPMWKQSLCRFCFCFLLGVFVGFTPFFSIGELRQKEFFLVNESPSTSSLKHDRVLETVKTESLIALELSATEETEEKLNFIDRKLLIIVTPTYNRALQSYYLTRLGHTLRLVAPPLLWVVVENDSTSTEAADVLRKTGVMYRHLICKENSTNVKDRGVHQRNAALDHIELHKLDGIVYFADDDNTYSLELFEQMRQIKRFGAWPVAMLAQGKAKAVLEGPVCNATQVIGWHTNEKSKRLRRFHVDMSGFAFNSTILWDPKRWRRPISTPIRQLDTVKEGFQVMYQYHGETTFIAQLVEDENQMQGIPDGCSRILNWHLHSEVTGFTHPRGWVLEKYLDVNVFHVI